MTSSSGHGRQQQQYNNSNGFSQKKAPSVKQRLRGLTRLLGKRRGQLRDETSTLSEKEREDITQVCPLCRPPTRHREKSPLRRAKRQCPENRRDVQKTAHRRVGLPPPLPSPRVR